MAQQSWPSQGAQHLFWRPGSEAPPASAALDRGGANDDHASAVPNANAGLSLTQQRVRLPVFASRREILYLVETHQTVVIVGHTGCGKTTQIPQYLCEAGWTAGGRVVACTQPRRVAAMTVAARVADEMGVELGADAVGYAVRFDVRACAATQILYLTEGTLMREMLADPLLSRFSVLMVDEAHERGVSTELCLALLKKVQKRRRDLRLVIASATLDAEALANFFGGTKPVRARGPNGKPRLQAPVAILSLSGARAHAVHRCFLAQPCADYVTEAVRIVLEIHAEQPAGDVLVFLTGQAEIEAASAMLAEAMAQLKMGRDRRRLADRHSAAPRPDALEVRALHGALGRDAQLAAFAPPSRGARKVVLATNIAETSVTLDGIVFVVDSGFVKMQLFDAKAGTEALAVAPISRAAAKQRAGRAGRTREGVCFHLYTRQAHGALAAATSPEVQRCSLEALVLQLLALGISNVAKFDLPTPPPAAHLATALELLHALDALDEVGGLTPLGARMVELPLSPMLGKLLLGAVDEGCAREALAVCALLSVQSVWSGPPKVQDVARAHFAVYEGDHVTLANVLRAYGKANESGRWATRRGLDARVLQRAAQVRTQLRRFLVRFGLRVESCGRDTDKLRRAVVRGFFPHAAQRQVGGQYRAARGGRLLAIHPRSVLFGAPPEWLIYHEVQALGGGEEAMLDVCKIEPEWLTELAPQFYEVQRVDKRARWE
ncbi:pre-mRNA-splicing factor ATP-dependent RNA helicase PRP16 [Pavlovales sp. CCMP2436]|nr:pre-mRNA-splicing factor ATP-dependent RNA helicase PRP16 [Pavlovales sp. CCMP2436]